MSRRFTATLFVFSTAIFAVMIVEAATKAPGNSSFYSQTEEASVRPALSSLVEAERSFARMSVEKGMHEAFFAEDGINFQPAPTLVREDMRKRPQPVAHPLFTLDWAPVYGDVSKAGDLGYTTGPFLLTDQSPQRRPPRHGMYFSIWKKQSDGSWKVVVDAGISTPEPVAPLKGARFRSAHESHPKHTREGVNLDAERAALMNKDRELFKAAGTSGMVNAFLDYSVDDARLHRDGMMPFVGRGAIRNFLSAQATTLVGAPIKSDVSQSADLGYTYGTYESKVGSAPSSGERGYYVRVWKSDARGKWTLTLDTTIPVPPPQK